ncbi:MAG: DUF1080 domain-containing protein [Planctomycetota bacterium]
MLFSWKSSAVVLAATFVFVTLPPAASHADEPIRLFDGETLNGWSDGRGGWEVVDGTLASVAGQYVALYADGEYADFALSFEFRLTPGANNGVALRAPGDGDPAYVGMESQILDNPAPRYASLEGYQYHGSIYGVVAAKRGALRETGEWNEQRIVCRGRRVVVELNGTTIVDADLDEAAPGGRTLDSKPHPGLMRSSGKIGLLGHADRVFFRNLTIVRLD